MLCLLLQSYDGAEAQGYKKLHQRRHWAFPHPTPKPKSRFRQQIEVEDCQCWELGNFFLVAIINKLHFLHIVSI